MSEKPPRSPFALAAHVRLYVPREATERCLEELARSLRAGERHTALTGPPGLGKTLMLHVLADRLGDELGFVHLPYGALPPEDLCAWAAGRLLLPQSEDPEVALLKYARRLAAQGSGLALLIDDAEGMPLETSSWVAALAADAGRALRLVTAIGDGPNARAVLESLGPEMEEVRLESPLDEAESRAYVRARLEMAQAPEATRARFDEATLSTLHSLSGGIPRRLHAVAKAVADGVSAEIAAHFLEDAKDEELAELVDGRSIFEPEDEDEGEEEAPPSRPKPPQSESAGAAQAPSPPRREARAPTRRDVFRGTLVLAAAAVAIVLARPRVEIEPTAGATSGTAPGVELPADPAVRPPARAPERPAAPASARPAPAPVSVQVNATPWANVEVDGVDVGVTPISGLPLIEGSHTFRARMPDGRVVEKVVEIDADHRFVVFE